MKFSIKIPNYLRSRKLQMYGAGILAAFTIWACNRDNSDLTSPIELPSGTEGVVQLKYTAEVMTYVKTDAQGGKLTGLEEIKAMPTNKRNEISMVVYDDGTCDMTMQELEPNFRAIKPNDLTPPSKEPKGIFTRIERSGKVHVFDKDKKEIRTFDMAQPTDLKQWVAIIKKDVSAANQSELVSYVFGNKVGGVQATVDEARKNGGEVISNNDGTVLVRIGNPTSAGLSARGENKTFSESVIDTVQKIVKAAAIFDKQSNKMLGKMAYTYKGANGSKELTHIYMESTNPNSPSNRQQKMICITELSGVSVKIKR